MKIHIAIPIKGTKDPLVSLGLEYLNRCHSFYKADVHFIDPRAGSEDDAKKRMTIEGDILLKKTEKSFRIALSERGKALDTADFSAYLEKLGHERTEISFLIGGAFGLSSKVLENTDATLSLSAMTLPHRLAFLVLCEQIYRASEIRRGSPYHK